jgi:MFS family permease
MWSQMFNDYEFPGLVKVFVVLSLLCFFAEGAAYYSFPMWLNMILPDYVSLSREEVTFVGGVTYVALGVTGALLLWYCSLGYSKKFEFLSLSIYAPVLALVAWLLLVLLVETPKSNSYHSFITIVISMICYGLGVGIFFMVWFGPMLAFFRPEWQAFANMLGNCAFTGGAILSLGIKFVLNGEEWFLILFVFLVFSIITPVAFIFIYYDKVFVQPLSSSTANNPPTQNSANEPLLPDRRLSIIDETPENEMTGLRLLCDLLFWKRQWKKEVLYNDKACDVSSRQFYFILGCYTSMQILSITFMANLGPLTGEESSDDDQSVNERSQLIIIIWSVAGQTFGRMILPIFSELLRKHLGKSLQTSSTSSHYQNRKSQDLLESKLRNRTTLPFVLLIGIIFLIGSLLLKFFNDFDFIYASTAISIGYGMNWFCTTLLVLFFPLQYAFTTFLSFFQVFSSLATLIMICIVSFLSFDNNTVFATLLILSCVTIGFAICTILDRLSTEVDNDIINQPTSVISPLIGEDS